MSKDKIILFLDDNPYRAALAYQRWTKDKTDKTIWVETAQEAIRVLNDYEIEEAHLDHDLGGQTFVDSRSENCGMEVIRWIEKQDIEKFKETRFVVHSHNMSAGSSMARRILNIGLEVQYIPFGLSDEIML